jgi:demethoxyubiquinone hydroxylase (CLK1/Coq7/Cat5 family)
VSHPVGLWYFALECCTIKIKSAESTAYIDLNTGKNLQQNHLLYAVKSMLRQLKPPGNVTVLPSRCSRFFAQHTQHAKSSEVRSADDEPSATENCARKSWLSIDQRRMLDSMLRVDVVVQQARTAFSAGRSCLAGQRPDVEYQEEINRRKVEMATELMCKYNARPSLGGPLVAASFGLLGLMSNAFPRAAASAVEAGFEDAFLETFNDHLRRVRESGIAENVSDVRQLIRHLRALGENKLVEVSEGPPLKSFFEILQSRSMTPIEGIAAVSKGATKFMLTVVNQV